MNTNCNIAKFFLYIIIGFFSGINLYGQKTAILISAGETYHDDGTTHSEYWYDLFDAYKELINLGYSHDDIVVLYGDGEDFVSNHDMYNSEEYGWHKIVDFNNSKSTIYTILDALEKIKAPKRDLLIRWVVGHGSISNRTGKYEVTIENTNERIEAETLLAKISLIKSFKTVSLVWMTCHSGCIIQSRFNKGVCMLASSTCDEVSWSEIYNGIPKAEMNYVFDHKLANTVGRERMKFTFKQMGDYLLHYNLMRSTPGYFDLNNIGNLIKFKY